MRNVVHFDIILRFTLLSVLAGAGFGLTIRFFNIFFQQGHQASDGEVGTILGLGAIASAASILVSPLLAQGWGKAKSILITQGLSVPFLLLMTAAPSLAAVTTIFLVRGAIYSIGMPLRNQLTMEFIDPKERGTTAGFTHTAFDIGGGLGAGIAGVLILDSGFGYAFTAAALLILVPAVFYYVFFDPLETKARQEPRALRGAAALG